MNIFLFKELLMFHTTSAEPFVDIFFVTSTSLFWEVMTTLETDADKVTVIFFPSDDFLWEFSVNDLMTVFDKFLAFIKKLLVYRLLQLYEQR